MARTFEALIKAEEENQVRRELTTAFEPEPPRKPPRRVKFKVPSDVSEEFHRIKQNILTNPGEKIKTILFSSPTGREGSSTVVVNFGIALASNGERVLLVDANLREPSLHLAFDLERENGLSDLILDKGDSVPAMKETRFSNLFVITCGRRHSNPTLLLESGSLDFYIQEMKAQADWVIFDSPPINASNESVLLATKVDGVVMVVEAERTRWQVAESAKQKIESNNGRILGVVLNNRKFYIPEWLYRTL